MVWGRPRAAEVHRQGQGERKQQPACRRQGGHGKADGEALEGVQPHQKTRRQKGLPGGEGGDGLRRQLMAVRPQHHRPRRQDQQRHPVPPDGFCQSRPLRPRQMEVVCAAGGKRQPESRLPLSANPDRFPREQA